MPVAAPVAGAAASAGAGDGGRPQPLRGKGLPTTSDIPGLPLHISRYENVGRNDECPCGSG